MTLTQSAEAGIQEPKPFGRHFLRGDGTARTVAILLFDGVTAQDFIGGYSLLNIAGGDDLRIDFVAKVRGPIKDERGRLTVYANKSIGEVDTADLFIVPGGIGSLHVCQDPEVLAWVKRIYDSSEFTISVCTGAVILGAAGAIRGKRAGTAWLAREALAPLGVTYVPTPPTAVDGKLYSAAGAAGGIEACLLVMEQMTGSKELSQTMEFAAEWNPRMLYESGDPQRASPGVIESFGLLVRTDPMFASVPLP
jgi:putative intracellular protease/amidase